MNINAKILKNQIQQYIKRTITKLGLHQKHRVGWTLENQCNSTHLQIKEKIFDQQVQKKHC